MAEDGGSNSPEYEVFRENYDDLVRVDVAKVARLAFSSNFISRESNDVAHNEYTTSTGRANHVLSAILNKVEEKASNFNVFLSCLREVPPMKDMALSLEAQVVAKAHSLTEHTQHLSVSSGQSPNPSKAQEMNGLDNVPRNEGKTGSSDISYYGHTYEKNDLVQNMILKEKAKLSVKVYSEEQNDHDVMHTVQEAKESPNVVKDDSELQAALHSKTLELQSVKEHKKSLIGQLKRAQLLLAEHNLSSMTEDHDNLKVMPKLITHHIVVYGVQECPKGTVRYKRLESDMEQITSIIFRINPGIPKDSIRGCLRLGKYSESKFRPVLVRLSRKSEVLSILAMRQNLASLPGISIKPEMTHEERRTEMLLLQKRRELIDAGVDRSSIKLKQDSLYVDDKKSGTVQLAMISDSQISVSNEERQVFQTRIAYLEKENVKAQQMLEDSKREHEEKIKELEENMTTSETELVLMSAELYKKKAEYTHKLLECQQQVTQYEREKNRLLQELQSKVIELSKSKQENARLSQRIAEQMRENAKEKKRKAEEQAEFLRSESEALLKKLEEYEKEMARLKQQQQQSTQNENKQAKDDNDND